MTIDSELVLEFEARGRSGTVTVSVSRNVDPAALGAPPSALDFPVCRASVEFQADGYDALLGWIQLVREDPSRDAEAGHFAMDPLQIYDGLETPFGLYGLCPQLFDAPSRSDRTRPLDWLAESFLCVAPTRPMAREASPVAAFSWGFIMNAGAIDIVEPQPLPAEAWTKHTELLRRQYPSWTFLDRNDDRS